MDVLHFLSICYKAYDGSYLTTLVSDGASPKEMFNGIIIESYHGIFCSQIITRFGVIRVSHGGMVKDISVIDKKIQSRITYKEIIKKNIARLSGCIGPFYLVTHIDDIPIEHDDVDGININNYYEYVKKLYNADSDFPAYIEDCMKRGLIKDSGGYIDRLLDDPSYYPEAVSELVHGIKHEQYRNKLVKEMYYHIFSLLYDKRLLLF